MAARRAKRFKSFGDLKRHQQGKAATRASPTGAPPASRLAPGADHLTCTPMLQADYRIAPLTNLSTSDALEICRRETVRWAEEQCNEEAPRTMVRHRTTGRWGQAATCRAVRHRRGDTDFWAVQVAHNNDRSYITTEVRVVGSRSQGAWVHIDIPDESSAPLIPHDAFPATMLARIARDVVLLDDTRKIQCRPTVPESREDMAALGSLILDDARTMSVVVVTTPSGDHDPEALERESCSLARDLTGLALVWTLNPEQTYRLTEMVQKELSVFKGAWRLYEPGFRLDANRLDHPLFMPDKLDRAPRTIVRRATALRAQKTRPSSITAPGFESIRAQAFESKLHRRIAYAWRRVFGRGAGRRATRESGEPARVRDPRSDVKEHEDQAADPHPASDGQTAQVDERAAKLQGELLAAKDELAQAERRNQRLVGQVRLLGGDPDAGAPFPIRWDEVSAWCEDHLDGLVLTPAARRELGRAVFQDVELVARCLHWLATSYRTGRQNGGNNALMGPIDSVATGIHNRPCGNDTFDCSWEGRRHQVDWHIKRGGNTHDPRRCLRIYYFWDEQADRVVVASLPAHRKNAVS